MIATLCSMLVVFAMFAFTATPAVAQTSFDPQSLIGEWSGKWSGIWGTGSATLSGDYVLRIRKVEGEKVFGGSGVDEPGYDEEQFDRDVRRTAPDLRQRFVDRGGQSHDRHPARDELPSGDQRRTGQDEVA